MATKNVTVETTRNWLDLPNDVTILIFTKVGVVGILSSVQFVCSSWQTLSKEESQLFRSIKVYVPLKNRQCIVLTKDTQLFDSIKVYVPLKDHSCNKVKLDKLVREAVDRSCGELVEIDLKNFGDQQLLHYMVDSSRLIQSLILFFCHQIDGNTQIFRKLPLLKVLHLFERRFKPFANITEIGRSCPLLMNFAYHKWLQRDHTPMNSEVFAIADGMPQLRYLRLRFLQITDEGMQAILDKCPHLQYLDFKNCGCFLTEDMLKKCRDSLEHFSIRRI